MKTEKTEEKTRKMTPHVGKRFRGVVNTDRAKWSSEGAADTKETVHLNSHVLDSHWNKVVFNQIRRCG